MQNFVNNNYDPNIDLYQQFPDPSQNEPFNRATHPADKPIVSKHIFAIDSRQRDYNQYPNANNYNIHIPERYRNVTSIELKAAMLPRSEYNVNSANKYLDFSIGDYISKISTIGPAIITKLGKPYVTNGKGETNIPLKIESPILTGDNIIQTQAEIHVDLDADSKIIRYNIINAGAGYSYSKPPRVSLEDFSNFNISVGKEYIAQLREGQYTIGGNPQMTDNNNSNNGYQSWVPNNLICEIENSMTHAILGNDFTDYCYSRKAWTSSNTLNVNTDYPLLFTSRIMSQYPSLDTYSANTSSRNLSTNYETNACKFNRIYTTNCLIFSVDNLPPTDFTDDNDFSYSILKYDEIIMGSDTRYIIYCRLNNALQVNTITGKFWTGISNVVGFNIELSHWEFLFATGENQIVNSASLLGFNKMNYYKNVYNIPIEVSHVTSNNFTTLVPSGLTYSSNNDYYLFGDPEYIILSFRPKFGDNTILGINNRVDSQPDSNINKVFACLILDPITPAVLQDMSSGKLDTTIGSLGYTNNNLNSFMNNDSNFDEVKQLTGNSGSLNTSFNRGPGMMRAMKGNDFDRKIVEFPQPVAQIFDMSIRFSKFTKQLGHGTDGELYDFHGKEHLLLFEITCSDLLTGKRF